MRYSVLTGIIRENDDNLLEDQIMFQHDCAPSHYAIQTFIAFNPYCSIVRTLMKVISGNTLFSFNLLGLLLIFTFWNLMTRFLGKCSIDLIIEGYVSDENSFQIISNLTPRPN